MSILEAMPPAPQEQAPDTFCVYLAKQLIVKKKFSLGTVPEARPITAQSDIVLSLFDGMSVTVIGLIDRESHPDKSFTLTHDWIEEIGQQCLKYSGQLSGKPMPLTIQLMEVGPGSDDQFDRLSEIKQQSLFSKIVMSAWVVDTDAASVWTTASLSGRGMRGFIEELLTAPRENLAIPPPIANPPATKAWLRFPWLTAAIILVLIAIFAAEIKFGIGGTEKDLKPRIITLLAFGGLSRNLILNSGEWYRLFSAPFLHSDFIHLIMNVASLGLAGHVLESLIGRAWFAAIYVIGAIGGSLLSLMLIPADIVSVGASGAIMGLFAATLILSFHFPAGDTHTGLLVYALYMLVPSLLPLTSALKGGKVDYAAHFGGAFGGIAVALVALALWRSADTQPRFRIGALLVALVGGISFALAAVPIRQNYPIYEFSGALAPREKIPADAATWTQSAELVEKYPRDPRLRLMQGHRLLIARDMKGAERELRAGLSEEDVWRTIMSAELGPRIRTMLALVLVDTNRWDEAKDIARPACEMLTTGPFRGLLDTQKLCDG